MLITVILLHIAVIVRVISYDIAWGGRLKTDSEMYVFEVISILFNLFFGAVLLMKGDYIKSRFKSKTIDIILWIFLALFALNTVGNIFAKTNLEKSLAVFTLVFVILIWKIMKTKNNINTKK